MAVDPRGETPPEAAAPIPNRGRAAVALVHGPHVHLILEVAVSQKLESIGSASWCENSLPLPIIFPGERETQFPRPAQELAPNWYRFRVSRREDFGEF